MRIAREERGTTLLGYLFLVSSIAVGCMIAIQEFGYVTADRMCDSGGELFRGEEFGGVGIPIDGYYNPVTKKCCANVGAGPEQCWGEKQG